MKNLQSKQHFANNFRHLTPKKYGFSILEHFVGPLCHAKFLIWFLNNDIKWLIPSGIAKKCTKNLDPDVC